MRRIEIINLDGSENLENKNGYSTEFGIRNNTTHCVNDGSHFSQCHVRDIQEVLMQKKIDFVLTCC